MGENPGLNDRKIGLLNPQCNRLASEHLDYASELFGEICRLGFLQFWNLKRTVPCPLAANRDLHLLFLDLLEGEYKIFIAGFKKKKYI